MFVLKLLIKNQIFINFFGAFPNFIFTIPDNFLCFVGYWLKNIWSCMPDYFGSFWNLFYSYIWSVFSLFLFD